MLLRFGDISRRTRSILSNFHTEKLEDGVFRQEFLEEPPLFFRRIRRIMDAPLPVAFSVIPGFPSRQNGNVFRIGQRSKNFFVVLSHVHITVRSYSVVVRAGGLWNLFFSNAVPTA